MAPLQEVIDKFWKMYEKIASSCLPFFLKVSARDDVLVIGFCYKHDDEKLNMVKIPEQMREAFKQVNQSIDVQVNLVTSLEDIIGGEEPVAHHLMKGFSLDTNVQHFSNIKDILKVEDDNLK